MDEETSHLMDSYILDENGNVVKAKDIHEWAAFFHDHKKREVMKTFMLGGRIYISTVFLGIDHNWTGLGDPVVFETMVFAGSYSELYMDRYTNRASAIEGHHKAVKWAKRHYHVLLWGLCKMYFKRVRKAFK